MQKRLVLVCEDSLCPRKQPDVSGPGLGEAGRYSDGAHQPLLGLGAPDQGASQGPRHGRWAKSSGDQPNILPLDLLLYFQLYIFYFFSYFITD